MKKQHSDWRQGVSHEKLKKEYVNVCSPLIDFFSYDSGVVISLS